MSNVVVDSEAEFSAKMAQEINRRTDKLSDLSVDLAIRAKQAREFLEWHTDHMKKAWMDWVDESNKVFQDIKQTRTAIEWESKHLLTACADVRKFFLSEEHAKEVARLREFVEVMERLRSLKQDGTLDAISDTILKLYDQADKPAV